MTSSREKKKKRKEVFQEATSYVMGQPIQKSMGKKEKKEKEKRKRKMQKPYVLSV